MEYIQICKAEYLQPQRFQISGPLSIFFHFHRVIMLRTVQLYNQLCPVTIEINNKVADHILPAKLAGIPSEKLIPKEVFFLCLVFSECLGIGF